jgi:histidine triad (HIT) family protein
MECLFCRIASGELKTEFVYEDDEIVAFRDITPQAPIHVLIIPRRHIATLNDLTPADAGLAGKMTLVAAIVAKNLGADTRGYRFVFNCNKDAGQAVFHIHGHLLAGRRMEWPPG